MNNIHEQGAYALEQALRHGENSPTQLTAHFLQRIQQFDSYIGAFVEVTPELSQTRAAELAAHEPTTRQSLWGLPFADKDLTARKGVPTRYGSALFQDHVPEVSDALAERLDDAGAISLGKTSTPEFGMTGFTEPQIAPPTRNPWDLTTGAGGSSGGAAAAVSAGLVPWAAASDGGGSIRIPAATCGVVGLKPSRGRLPIGSGLDSPDALAVSGAITTTITDAAFLLDVLTSLAPYPYSVQAPRQQPDCSFLEAVFADASNLRVGMTLVTPWDEAIDITLDPNALAAYDWAARVLASEAATIEEAVWKPEGYPELFGTLWRASAARIPVSEAQFPLVEPITAWLMQEGRSLPSERLVADLSAARRFERETIVNFMAFDAVLTPALALSPRPVGWYDGLDPQEIYDRQVQYAPHTSWVNVAGLPAISVPVLADTTGRPVSVQLVGKPGGEAALLTLAARLEAARGPLPRPARWFAAPAGA